MVLKKTIRLIVVADKINFVMKSIILIATCFFVLVSCENTNPAFRFSNFKGTQAESLSRAIESEDINTIRYEVIQKKVNVNSEDTKYETSLLELAITNYKKEAFEELLKLGADPNIENFQCESVLISAIRYNDNCDLYFVKRLLENGAEINPRFFEKCNYFSDEPICETIKWYNDDCDIECGYKILKLLTSKLNDTKILSQYNNSKDYQQNIVYNCLSTGQNIRALKYLIVDLKYEVPEEIYIDGTVLFDYDYGFKDFKEILEHEEFIFEDLDREKAKNDILSYLENNNK
jgi:hypothetical protein